MRYACCDERRLRAVKEAGSAERHRVPRGLRLRGADARSCASGRCSSASCSRRPGSPPPTSRSPAASGSPTVGVEWAAPADRAAGGRGRRRSSPGSTTRPPCCSSAPTRAATSRATRCGWSPARAATRRRPASTRCSQRGRVLVQGRVPVATSTARRRAIARPSRSTAPAIDYLAKDFDSFRALMLDRISLLAPDWTERTPADVGVDARRAARLRRRRALLPAGRDRDRGVPRHGTPPRLAAAPRAARRLPRRTRAATRAPGSASSSPPRASRSTRGTPLLTRVPGVAELVEPGDPEPPRRAGARAPRRSRPSTTRSSTRSHERLDFWTWGDAGCCLPRGATSATLLGDHPQLKAGDVLVLAEVASPTTGQRRRRGPRQAPRRPPHRRRVGRRSLRRAVRRPAERTPRSRSPRSTGTSRRAAVRALHLGRGRARPGRQRGLGQHRARRPRPHDRRRAARRGAGAGARLRGPGRLRPVRAGRRRSRSRCASGRRSRARR